jgi:hypothetical protein
MNPSSEVTAPTTPPLKSALRPSLTLAVLAPLIAEVLSGATRLSFIFVFLPEIMVWGVGALLIRELVRRWKAGPTSLTLLALALSVAEEWIIQQPSLAPLPWAAGVSYGRHWHVNWLWFLFFLGYESVWVVLIPMQLTEMSVPTRRSTPWLSRLGLCVSAFIFLLGSCVAWFLWTQIARPKTFHVAKYQPPIEQLILGVLMIAALAVSAYLLRTHGTRTYPQRPVPPAWAAALVAILLTTPWYLLLVLNFGVPSRWPVWVPMIAGCVWAGLTWTLIRYWTSSDRWTDLHRLALCFGATTVSMACGFLGSNTWPRKDIIAKVVLNLAAIVIFLVSANRLKSRPDQPNLSSAPHSPISPKPA